MRRDEFSRYDPTIAGPADGQLDLSGLASALWRRKFWIIVPTILAGIAAAVFVTLATPQYSSQAQVLIENQETAYSRPEGSERVADRQRPDQEAVASEVQLALSRDLARSVVRDLKLTERPEFNPEAGLRRCPQFSV
jgi:polysaccharide biosynthesis transport protein